MQIQRRAFLALAAAPAWAERGLVTLDAGEARLIEAISDTVIPADDAPGAAASGVVTYIDRQLAGPLARFREAYRVGAGQFDAACRAQHARSFAELDADARTAFLHNIDAQGPPALRGFFRMVADHTMQGFYGSPVHGGNRGEASWRMLAIVDVMEGHAH